MINSKNPVSVASRLRRLMPVTAAAVACSITALCGVTGIAQAAPPHHTGFLHRHRATASIGAAIAAHHYAKKGARARAATGRRGTFAERHPNLSAGAAGLGTHHLLKHH